MTDETDFKLPPNAVPYGDERFAYIGANSREPDAFFLRDDGGKWHCVDACDFYAVTVWYDYGADLAITEDASTGNLSAHFRDWLDGTSINLFPIAWHGNQPFRCRGAGEFWFFVGDENGTAHRVSEADYNAVVQWREQGIDLFISKEGEALTVRNRKDSSAPCLVVPVKCEEAA